MIKIFRKIRQEMLSDNKFSKYLFYAIGEIILVVIGILIALAINNNNQSRVIKANEQTYLKGLKEEFQTSKFKLNELMEVNKSNYNGAKQILEFTFSENDPPAELKFSELLFNTFSSDIFFNPNNSLLNEMINSGSLKDISNAVLRIKLTNWISNLEDINQQERELGVQREKILDLFRTNEHSLRIIFENAGVMGQLGLSERKNEFGNLKLLNSLKFENNLLMFILTSYATEKAHYVPLMADLNEILEIIDKEIK